MNLRLFLADSEGISAATEAAADGAMHFRGLVRGGPADPDDLRRALTLR